MKTPRNLRHRVIDSPIGPLTLVVDESGALTGVHMAEDRHPARPESLGVRDDSVAAEAARQLAEFFAGEREAFDLRLAPSGTEFQLAVWEQLRTIPFGKTWTYGELATAIGKPGAARAVGGATGRNPIAIVVPCHRLVGSGGALTGFGGGLERQQFLLALEQRH